MYNEMIGFVRQYIDIYGNESGGIFPFRNSFEHTMRVLEWVKKINDVEKGDKEIVEIAAIFHDVGKGIKSDQPHAIISSQMCEDYLKNTNFDEEKIKKISQAVRIHTSKKNPPKELSLEDKILMDADLIDEAGAMMVLWDSIASGKDSNIKYSDVYYRILKQLDRRKSDFDLLKTDEGKRLYGERVQCLESFVNNLKFELCL